MFETQTFLAELPDGAASEATVGYVEITDTGVDNARSLRISQVRVVKAIKGLADTARFAVHSELHSCARDAVVEAGQTYYVAGELKDGVFAGAWQGLPYGPFWRDGPDPRGD